jgi:hypothetical protein
MQALESPLNSRGHDSSIAKFKSSPCLPSVPSSPECDPKRSPVLSERPSFASLDQLQYYEECIAKVSQEVSITRDECVALQRRLWLSDSELREKVATIDCLIAEKQQMKQELREKVAIVEKLASKNIELQDEFVLKTNETLVFKKAADERLSKLVERDGSIMVLTTFNEQKENEILRLKATIAELKSEHNQAIQQTNQSHRIDALRLQESIIALESTVKSLQLALQEEQLLTLRLREDQKAHNSTQHAGQSQRIETLRLQESLIASESAVKSLQHALQEEQLLTQRLREDQKALVAIQQSDQSRRIDTLRLQELLTSSESNCSSLKFALEEERLLNQKFGKVEHLLSSCNTVSAFGQSFVSAELEAEKKLSERLKAALEESTQINSRILHANSAYRDKVEDLQARIISCNARVFHHVVPVCDDFHVALTDRQAEMKQSEFTARCVSPA